ncbi:MAG TPA: response regulator [Gemmatimonadales bacterium]|jgi:PleD family two-component response regulator
MSNQTPVAALPLALLAGDRERSIGPVEAILTDGGYAVLSAPTGRAMLARVRGIHPDVIVIDAELPDMSAADATRALRLDPAGSATTPILVALHRAPTRDDRLAALRAGAWDCLGPPFDPEEVRLKVDAFVHAKLDADRTRAEGLLDLGTGLYNRQGLARRARELGSQAYRQRGAIACVTLALDLDADAVTAPERAAAAVVHCVQALQSVARVSDAIGRLGPTEFAVLAPATDERGAVKLAERLVRGLEGAVAAIGRPSGVAQVRAGYDAVANVKYTPIEPMDLLTRATAALRRGEPEPGKAWLRRISGGHRAPGGSPL